MGEVVLHILHLLKDTWSNDLSTAEISSTGGNPTTDRPSKSSCENLENVRLGCKIRHEAFHVNLGIDFSVNFIMCSKVRLVERAVDLLG